ncbi:MAG: sigma-70 family RNA polymerase sigma factor [Planctomycetota bacterium]
MSESNVTIDELLAHAGWLRALALRLVGDAGADDLVQEVWLRAAKRPPGQADSPRGWLKAVLRSVHVRQLERKLASRDRERQVASAEGLPSTSELLGRAEAQRGLVEAVVGLDEPYRRTLLLHYFEGLSAAEIARRSGDPSSTVRNRLARGLDRLRETLDASPGGRTSWIPGMALLVPPEVGLASLTPLGFGSLVMWKITASAAAVAVLGWLGASLLLSEPDPVRSSPSKEESAAVASSVQASADGSVRLDPVRAVPEDRVEVDASESSTSDPDRAFGVVVGPDRSPLVGATVLGPGDMEATTDSEGRFAVAAPRGAEAELRLAITAPGHVVVDGVLRPRRKDGGLDLGTIMVDRAAELSGFVVDANGQPVGGVELRLESTDAGPYVVTSVDPIGEPAATTSTSGAFTLAKLPVGPWRIRADHPEHPTTEFEGASRRPGVQPDRLTLPMRAGGSLSGRVIGQFPAGDLRVVAVRLDAGVEANLARAVEAKPDGSFELRGLLVDVDYEVVLVDATDTLARGEARSSRVIARPGDGPIELLVSGYGESPPKTGSGLRFRVVDGKTGQLIPRCEVSYRDGAQGFPGSLTQGLRETVAGSLQFEGLPATKIKKGAAVRIEAPGYAFYEVGGVRMELGAWTDLGEVRLRRSRPLRVRVIDDVTSLPVAGANVAMSGYPLRALAPAALRAQECASCHGGAEGDRVPEGNSITPGTCYPLYQQKVYTPFEWVALTDASGEAVVELGSDVPVRAVVSHPDHVAVELDRARYGANELLEVRMPGGGRLVTRVLEFDGAPVVGATVTSDSGESRTTDADGRVVFERLAAGAREIVASRRPMAKQMVVIGSTAPPATGTRQSVRVRAGETAELTLRLDAVSDVAGVVTEQGEPLAGATVRLERERAGSAQVLMLGGGSSVDQVRTLSDGSFELSDVDPGGYSIVITHPDRAMADRFSMTVTPGSTRASFDLPLAIVQGIVMDDTGEPISGARVSVRASGSGRDASQSTMVTTQTVNADGTVASQTSSRGATVVRTDRGGRFELRGVQSGADLEISVRGRRGLSGRKAIGSLRSGEQRTGVEVELVARGTLRFQVGVRGGLTEAFPKAVLQRTVDGEPFGEERVVSGGPAFAVVDDLEPGTYLARGVLSDGRRTEPEMITIEAGRTTNKTFRP